jgi:hypothetical protein
MATPKYARWVGNAFGASAPLVMLGKFAAGASVPVERGELLELTGNTNTEWVPMDSDFAMSANVAIANEQIKSGDLAGYYEIIVPRDGDMFEFDLAAAGTTAVGTAVYWSSSTVVATSGSNVLGDVIGMDHYPEKQGHASSGDPLDRGTTIRSTSKVTITIKKAASYYTAVQQ